MNEVPLWLAIPLAGLLVIGSTLILLGASGLVRLRTFYQRMHAPSLITSWGTGAIVLASVLFYSGLAGKPVLHDIILGAFIMITTPITMLLLGRAAVQRDQADGLADVPPKPADTPKANPAPGKAP
ncbi:MAG TPA: monovalent cation/H(+) antiporter subunit G [Paenirhodobacter sp.]